MSTSAFQIKRNDTLPAISAQLSTSLGPIDLTGATIHLILTPVPVPQVGIFAQQQQPVQQPAAKVRGLCTIFGDPTLGNVTYNWAVGDTSIAGNYYAEFEIDNGSTIQTCPTASYIPVQIVADLG